MHKEKSILMRAIPVFLKLIFFFFSQMPEWKQFEHCNCSQLRCGVIVKIKYILSDLYYPRIQGEKVMEFCVRGFLRFLKKT
jgi:hypothetical protein